MHKLAIRRSSSAGGDGWRRSGAPSRPLLPTTPPMTPMVAALVRATLTVLAAATAVVAAAPGDGRRGLDGRIEGRVDDGEAAVERRLGADGALSHRQRQTRVVGVAVAARHALTSQPGEEVT